MRAWPWWLRLTIYYIAAWILGWIVLSLVWGIVAEGSIGLDALAAAGYLGAQLGYASLFCALPCYALVMLFGALGHHIKPGKR